LTLTAVAIARGALIGYNAAVAYFETSCAMRQRNCQLKVSSNHLDFALSMLKTQFCVSFGIGCDRNNLTDFVQIA
jgi:hypothetical protein